MRAFILGLSIRSRKEYTKVQALSTQLEGCSLELQRITSKMDKLAVDIAHWSGTNPPTEEIPESPFDGSNVSGIRVCPS